MEIADLVSLNAVIPKLKASSKKQALQELSSHAAKFVGHPAHQIFDVLRGREQLGTTGIGQGVAIPHGKIAGLDRIYGFFARLAAPIDFESLDGQPVDLIFMLLAPETAGADHLKALARVSRLLRDQRVCDKIRGSNNADAIYALLTESPASHAA
ncbi:MAG: PTS IIA-like nitrogen regulatory protein PtsN [Sphingomonadales bacterium]|jgi:PTS system nitrogen regulatory IIA component|nr:PTS IIA-like nitrogen regulatory protein PtsN [Sphingomonadales bacterium]RIK95254.1 MAG: PTS IIA-like nitrogen-regulatory protein PtsN [Pseudomonadota bacterium]